MPSNQPALAPHPHRNRRLFSDHYLDTVLPGLGEWRVGAEGATQVRDEIAGLTARFVPSGKEAQTEEELVRPILRLLGHSFEVQPSLKTPDGWKVPDYVLYADEAARLANKNVVLSDAVLQRGLAVADAKYWDRPLDQALSGPLKAWDRSVHEQESGLSDLLLHPAHGIAVGDLDERAAVAALPQGPGAHGISWTGITRSTCRSCLELI